MFLRRLQDVFKTCLQRNNFSSSETSSRRLQDVLEDKKLLRWRRFEDVFKTCFEDVFKTSSRPTNVCWEAFKRLSLAFDKVWFLNFVDINIEIFAGVNFAIAVNETLYFWHLVLSCRLWYFWNFFSEIYVALINWDIAFCIYKDIWKQSKSIITVSINVITNDIFIIISISYIINELTELHQLTFIASFLFFLIAKVHIGKLK